MFLFCLFFSSVPPREYRLLPCRRKYSFSYLALTYVYVHVYVCSVTWRVVWKRWIVGVVLVIATLRTPCYPPDLCVILFYFFLTTSLPLSVCEYVCVCRLFVLSFLVEIYEEHGEINNRQQQQPPIVCSAPGHCVVIVVV